jgi:hypothetical protein
MPVLSLTKTQCTYIQAPSVQALLSKLHLNRSTSHAIIYGPSSYAGLALPDLYTSQGIYQLRLLLGHLRLQDKTAKLILIDISYLQLQAGSSTLFFNLNHQLYGKYVEQGWLVSIWQFLYKTKIKLHIRLTSQHYQGSTMSILWTSLSSIIHVALPYE